MSVVGGIRRRLIRDNFYLMVYDALEQLDWFDPGNNLIENPVEFVAEQIDPNTEIAPNKIGLSTEDVYPEDIELGSNLSEYPWEVYIDVFAEDEATGIHLSGDIVDILLGKMASIGRTGPVLEVYDLREDDPKPLLFYCELERVRFSRVREWDKQFNKYWWVVSCEIVDSYYGEES